MEAACKEAGIVMPEINLAACEGKAACLDVCPYGVFEVRKAAAHERSGLSPLGWLKSLAHGHVKAFVVDPAACHNCGACVAACPEQAITLTRYRISP